MLRTNNSGEFGKLRGALVCTGSVKRSTNGPPKEAAVRPILLLPSISTPLPTTKSSNTNDQAGKGEIRDRLCGYEGADTDRLMTKSLVGRGALCYSISAKMSADLHAM